MEVRVRELFFSLLRRALWGNEAALIDEPSMKELVAAIRLAKVQTVMELVANEVFNEPLLEDLLSNDAKTRLQLYVQSNALIHSKLNAVLIDIVSELRKHGIAPVLLKGQGIAEYYRIPELRMCGDIDIYVGQESFAKACEVIGTMSSLEDKQGDIHAFKHYHTQVDAVFVEIHRYTDVYFPHRYDKKYQQISDAGMHSDWVPLDFGDVKVLTPSLNFNVFYIFNHFWHHFIADGLGLRQICDWVRLLHVNYGKIDLNYLSGVLGEMGLMKEWKVFGYIAVHSLGLPAEEMPFYEPKYKKSAEKVLELILLEGNFGQENWKEYNRPKGYVAGKWYTFKLRYRRNLRVLRLFPKESIRHMSKIIFRGIAVMFNDKYVKYED